MPILIRNTARVELPNDEMLKALVLGMFSHTTKKGTCVANYSYSKGVCYLPPTPKKLEIIASLLGQELVDLRSSGQPLSEPFVFNPEFQFRSYQEVPASEFVGYIRENSNGILAAGCGTGKSCVLTFVAGQLQNKTLIILDQANLIPNWIDAFRMVYNKPVQIIKAKDQVFADVCLVTYQLLHRNSELLNRIKTTFGTLLADEAHCVSATTFRDVLLGLDNQYRIGCSATYHNKNLPLEVFEDFLGSVGATMVDTEALIPKVIVRETGVTWPSDDPNDFASVISPFLAMNNFRMAVTLGLMKEALTDNRRTIVVCIKEIQAQFLHSLIEKVGARSLVYTGATTRKTDEKVRRMFDSGELDFLLVCRKADKGLDMVSADCLILTAPNNNRVRTQQVTGRVVRKLEDKRQPVIYDLADNGMLAEVFLRNRLKWYKGLGYQL